MSSIVSTGQSLLDICLQELGDVSAAFDLADANGLAITDLLTPGQQLVVPVSLAGRPEVVRYFGGRGQRVNTGNQPLAEVLTPPEQPTNTSFFHPDFFNSENYG